jgi:hypothetical protein
MKKKLLLLLKTFYFLLYSILKIYIIDYYIGQFWVSSVGAIASPPMALVGPAVAPWAALASVASAEAVASPPLPGVATWSLVALAAVVGALAVH